MATSGETWRSKLNNAYRKKDIESWEAKLKSDLLALRKQPHNQMCFDCGAQDTTWASPKLGVFLCVSCSDIHRAAGAHITSVKNFNTYLWGPDEVEVMRAVGNLCGKKLYGTHSHTSTSKQEKAPSSVAKYDRREVQDLVQAQVAAATARSAESMAGRLQRRVVQEQLPVPKEETTGLDWFAELGLAETSAKPAACLLSDQVQIQENAADLDEFLAMCNGPSPVPTTKTKDICRQMDLSN
ncbi:unnamed protein product [Polarella glacialis]|uniref:Arf-GAP domain-containing protein n=2 Tax=Polarella glacialis TaxID=89957 RepID=A0A813D209_POLGL|nr:unnamed protein product [Polarella glacialis]CAE8640578.1 unnamed protein product [Polarella glacialis]